MIKTVKIQGDGYLVNGTLSVPKVNGNRHYEEVKEWIAEGNTPEPEFTQGELDQQAQEVINQEALAYLSSTDWMLLRELDGGIAMTAKVKDLRAEARLSVVQVS